MAAFIREVGTLSRERISNHQHSRPNVMVCPSYQRDTDMILASPARRPERAMYELTTLRALLSRCIGNLHEMLRYDISQLVHPCQKPLGHWLRYR